MLSLDTLAINIALSLAALGDNSFQTRQQAQQYLQVTLPFADVYLQDAVNSGDPEVRVRARRVLSTRSTWYWTTGLPIYEPEPIEPPDDGEEP